MALKSRIMWLERVPCIGKKHT